jgi:hypothetical protein
MSQKLQSINPVNGELIREYNYFRSGLPIVLCLYVIEIFFLFLHSDKELDEKMDKAWSAFQKWKDTDTETRVEVRVTTASLVTDK